MANRIVLALVVWFALVGSAYGQDNPMTAPAKPQPGGASSGVGGGVDPTENVKALVLLESKRQDELRTASDKFNASAIDHIKEMATLRADYDSQLRIAESKRIDAIRAVDVNAVAVASQKANDQAAALAKQVSDSAEALRKAGTDSAEALRTLVANTAVTAAATQQQQFSSLGVRITTLETASSEGKGKAGVNEPQYIALLAEVRALREMGAGAKGKDEGISTAAAIGMAMVTLVIMFAGVVVTFLVRRPKVTA